jgi:tetratricopeptide (TPR) repeat protein
MSLFIDVIEVLSNKIKAGLKEVIESEQKKHDRPIRRICDACFKYLDYGELRYDKMEDGISRLQETGISGNPLKVLLFAVLHESLDEDESAVKYFTEFSDSSPAEPFRQELTDFITIGRLITLKEYPLLENAGSILIDRYTDENTVTDTLSNLYLMAEGKEYLPVFQKLLDRAKGLYPASIQLEGFNGFIRLKGENYQKALESFLAIKERLEQDKDKRYYNLNLASAWDNIAGCYLKLGDASKTVESCDVALSYDENAEDYTVGNSILYKKAEAFLLLGEKELALAIVSKMLNENEDDEKALEIKNRIGAH